jgi:hypothetical protein
VLDVEHNLQQHAIFALRWRYRQNAQCTVQEVLLLLLRLTRWSLCAAHAISDLNFSRARFALASTLLSAMLQDDEVFEEFAESGLRFCAELQCEVPTRVSACAWFSSSQLAVCGDDGTIVLLHEAESTGTFITILSRVLRSKRTAN